MNYEEFVAEEKTIEANHPEFFTAGKKIHDYILIVFNLHTGYKRYEWIDEKGLPEEVKIDVEKFLERLEETKQQA